MNKVTLQVPIDKDLRDRAALVAGDLGFSSLQESVRVFLAQLAARKACIQFGFESEPIRLSPEASKRYDRLLDDIESRKEPVYSAKDAEDLLTQLNDH